MDWRELLKIADRLDPELRARFRAAIARLRNDIDVDLLARQIADGRLTSADLVADIKPLESDLQLVVDVMQRAMVEVGRAEAAALTGKVGTIAFDIANPYAVQFARQMAGQMITQIGDETRRAIRALVTRAYTDGITRSELSQFLRPLIGLTDNAVRAVLNYREMLLGEGGLSPSRVDALVAQYAERKLRERLATVARTELMIASNAGQQALWLQARARGLLRDGVMRKWVVTPDDRLCPRCEAMAGQLRALAQPFVCPLDGSEVLFPPLHPRCRCVVVLATANGRGLLAA